jgi:hypothetical protein
VVEAAGFEDEFLQDNLTLITIYFIFDYFLIIDYWTEWLIIRWSSIGY